VVSQSQGLVAGDAIDSDDEDGVADNHLEGVEEETTG
jgi:hypothetical protein